MLRCPDEWTLILKKFKETSSRRTITLEHNPLEAVEVDFNTYSRWIISGGEYHNTRTVWASKRDYCENRKYFTYKWKSWIEWMSQNAPLRILQYIMHCHTISHIRFSSVSKDRRWWCEHQNETENTIHLSLYIYNYLACIYTIHIYLSIHVYWLIHEWRQQVLHGEDCSVSNDSSTRRLGTTLRCPLKMWTSRWNMGEFVWIFLDGKYYFLLFFFSLNMIVIRVLNRTLGTVFSIALGLFIMNIIRLRKRHLQWEYAPGINILLLLLL